MFQLLWKRSRCSKWSKIHLIRLKNIFRSILSRGSNKKFMLCQAGEVRKESKTSHWPLCHVYHTEQRASITYIEDFRKMGNIRTNESQSDVSFFFVSKNSKLRSFKYCYALNWILKKSNALFFIDDMPDENCRPKVGQDRNLNTASLEVKMNPGENENGVFHAK